MMRRSLLRPTVVLSVFGALLTSGVALAQQESPLTKEMLEAKERREKAAAEQEHQLGDAYRDNPEWLEEEFKKQEQAEAEATAVEVGDEKEAPGYISGYRKKAGLGLSPLAPQQPSVLPGAITPPMGARDDADELRFDFHGYLQAGLRAGIGSRPDAFDGQQRTTLHGDPLVPGGAFGWFDHTNTVPVPWTQLNFQFGNDTIEATAVLGAWSLSESDEASGYFQPPSKLWFNDAFLTYTPDIGRAGLRVVTGVFSENYGSMAEYHSGAYGASLIGVIYGMGATSTLTLPWENDITTTIEGGVKGDFNRAPPELVLDQSNEFAPVIEGSTYAAHGHLAFDFNHHAELTAHGIYTFSQDDRADDLAGKELYLGDNPLRDGSMTVLGIDGRFPMKQYGHLYLGASRVIGKDTLTLSNLVQVLNNGPGRDLTRRYFTYDSGGNGSLNILGGQYDLSLGRLLRYPEEFTGGAPDLNLSFFGVYLKQKNEGELNPESDMLKFGNEITYSPFKWLVLSHRFDMVMPELGDSSQSFAVFTPKLVFRNDWSNQATLTMQYSAYLLGEDTQVRGDERLLNNPSELPDEHVLALFGTIWW